MEMREDEVRDRINIGVVIFAPFHTNREYFSLLMFEGEEEHLLTEIAFRGGFNPLIRIPNLKRRQLMWLTIPSSPDKEPISVFGRVNKGTDIEVLKQRIKIWNDFFKQLTIRERILRYKKTVINTGDAFYLANDLDPFDPPEIPYLN